jgi:hypothetical protein
MLVSLLNALGLRASIATPTVTATGAAVAATTIAAKSRTITTIARASAIRRPVSSAAHWGFIQKEPMGVNRRYKQKPDY